jgi:hypothetical protein
MSKICNLGDRIRLTHMGEDPDPIPVGATGTVTSITDMRTWVQIGVKWDINRSLYLSWPTDRFEIIERADDPARS